MLSDIKPRTTNGVIIYVDIEFLQNSWTWAISLKIIIYFHKCFKYVFILTHSLPQPITTPRPSIEVLNLVAKLAAAQVPSLGISRDN